MTAHISNTIEALKRSPLFNLSLSSKELFHSNFIAWLCDEYKVEFGKIISSRFLEKELVIHKVLRENKNLDLTIIFETNEKIVIENKVKSIPDEEQLINYSNSNIASKYILLTLIEPPFDRVEKWDVISYLDLLEMLEELYDIIDVDNKYHKNLIKDYCLFIERLSIVGKGLTENTEKEMYDYHGTQYRYFQDIRMHDFYIKIKFSYLQNKLHAYLFENNTFSKEVIKRKRYIHEEDRGKIVISINMVRGKGVMNIDYSDEDNIIYGIMLDGQRYLNYVFAWGDNNTENISHQLLKQKEWFQFNWEEAKEIYPQKGGFNKFGKMRYQAVKIPIDMTLNRLIEIIYKDVKRLIRLQSTL